MGTKHDLQPSPVVFLKRNGVNLAPLTGQDTRALLAIAAAWELYAVADERGRSATMNAVVFLLLSMQPKCRETTKKLIARAMNWSDVDRLWPVLERLIASFEAPAAPPAAIASSGYAKGHAKGYIEGATSGNAERIANEQRGYLRLVEDEGGDPLRELDVVLRGEVTRDRWDPQIHIGLCPDCLVPLPTEPYNARAPDPRPEDAGRVVIANECRECGWVLDEDGKRRRSTRSTREVIRERVKRGSLDLPPRPNFEAAKPKETSR